jgi:ATP-dependent exoDNAse (exonuclease V) alpha subunit
VREGAGDEGLTIAKALHLLRDNKLELSRQTLVIVDEAAMVGTNDLRQLLSATTTAGTKTVLVGDAHQLAPVKARGGMFAQLCTDLPSAQHLSEVWRMRNPEECSARPVGVYHSLERGVTYR